MLNPKYVFLLFLMEVKTSCCLLDIDCRRTCHHKALLVPANQPIFEHYITSMTNNCLILGNQQALNPFRL